MINHKRHDWLKTQYRHWKVMLKLAQDRPGLASYLLRQLKHGKAALLRHLQQASFLMSLHRPHQAR
ncbi:MAG: hypothetical protein AAF485_11960, partial [Chloroflexota bacterium]